SLRIREKDRENRRARKDILASDSHQIAIIKIFLI
ncbi:MAG: hypothetical protein RLZZ450_7654, partial [Pseudomonadota bacterium]